MSLLIFPGILSNTIEIDETYFTFNHKGESIPDITAKKRGSSATKRGLSNEQWCLITAVDRNNKSFAKCTNTAKPSAKNIIEVCHNKIEKGVEILTDGLASYNELIKKNNSRSTILKDTKDFDQVHHLNTVNSFHSKIKHLYSKYRGVASKYLNRYGALFVVQWFYKDCDLQEALLLIIKKLRSHSVYFNIAEIKTKCIKI